MGKILTIIIKKVQESKVSRKIKKERGMLWTFQCNSTQKMASLSDTLINSIATPIGRIKVLISSQANWQIFWLVEAFTWKMPVQDINPYLIGKQHTWNSLKLIIAHEEEIIHWITLLPFRENQRKVNLISFHKSKTLLNMTILEFKIEQQQWLFQQTSIKSLNQS